MAPVMDLSMAAEAGTEDRGAMLARVGDEAALEDFYSKSGIWQAIARHKHYRGIATGITVFFLVWMGIETDNNDAPTLSAASAVFQLATVLFLLAFTFDVLVRALAFKRKADILKMDKLLVVEAFLTGVFFLYLVMGLASADTAGQAHRRVLQVLYYMQAGRVARLVSEIPELSILVKGMLVAARAVFFTIVLLLLVLYVSSMCLVGFARTTRFGESYFPTVPEGQWTLLLRLVLFQDLGGLLESAKEESAALVIFLVVVSVVVASVLFVGIGVLLEVVRCVALREKNILVSRYLVAGSAGIVGEALGEQCAGSGMDKGQVDQLFSNARFLEFLRGCFWQFSASGAGLDFVDLKDMVDMQFEAGKQAVTHKEVMGLVVEMSGPDAAAIKSMLRLKRFMAQRV